MTLEVRFHPLATAEVVEAQLWYEDRGDALGFRFLDADVLGSSRGVR